MASHLPPTPPSAGADVNDVVPQIAFTELTIVGEPTKEFRLAVWDGERGLKFDVGNGVNRSIFWKINNNLAVLISMERDIAINCFGGRGYGGKKFTAQNMGFFEFFEFLLFFFFCLQIAFLATFRLKIIDFGHFSPNAFYGRRRTRRGPKPEKIFGFFFLRKMQFLVKIITFFFLCSRPEFFNFISLWVEGWD